MKIKIDSAISRSRSLSPNSTSGRTLHLRDYNDYRNPDVQRILAAKQLRNKYNLRIEIPDNRLCPGIASRAAYIEWIVSLCNNLVLQSKVDSRPLLIDIGTGATCIYPLLGCKIIPDSRFIATEIDPVSFELAVANVQRNGLSKQIFVIQSDGSDNIFSSAAKSAELGSSFKAIASLCNPPFYSSRQQMRDLTEIKAQEAPSTSSGADNEVICDNGEVGFISRMINDSKIFRNNIVWFTSLVGMFSNIDPLVSLLKTEEVSNYTVGELVYGTRTKRWVLAWSFSCYRPPKMLQSSRLPGVPLSQFSIDIVSKLQLEDIKQFLDRMNALEINVLPEKLIVKFQHNTWSRSARRQLKRGEILSQDLNVFQVDLDGKSLKIAWIFGEYVKTFESFCGALSKHFKPH